MLKVKTVLYPIDFSEPCLQAVRDTTRLLPGDVEFVLLNVREHASVVDSEIDLEEEAKRNLAVLIADFLPPAIKARALVRSGDITGEIIQAAIREKCDLIVMPTHGATGWREFAMGSITDEVVRLAPCPVLTLNQAALAKRNEIRANGNRPEAVSQQVPATVDSAPVSPPGPSDPDAETAFPNDGSAQSKLRFLLHYAILAPSNRNSQPWLWRFNGDAVDLYADPMRAMPYLDPVDRELILSCGAALMHLRIAIRHFGYSAEVETFPHPEVPGLLARIRLGAAAEPPEQENGLFEAIFTRHTNRSTFLDRELPVVLLQQLEAEARREGATLFFVKDPARRQELIDLIAASDLSQRSNVEFLSEDWKWIYTASDIRTEGLRENSWRLRGDLKSTHPGVAQANNDRLLAWSAPVLAVLETDDDTPRDWLAAGQALARVLLRAGAEGVQANFFNSPVEVRSMWPRLHHLLRHASLPQMILRLGYPTLDAEPTPRRAVSDVLL